MVWTSESCLTCSVVAGIGHAQRVTLTVDRQQAQYIGFSYTGPFVESLSMLNGPTKGGKQITIRGYGFGAVDYSVSPFVGSSLCLKAGWHSETSLFCTVASGVGSRNTVGIKFLSLPVSERPGQVFRFSNRCSLHSGRVAPYFSYDSSRVDVLAPSLASVKSGTTFTFSGSNFGVVDYSVRLSVGHSRCANAQWTSDTALKCIVLPGLGFSHAVVVTLSDPHIVIPRISYFPASVSSITYRDDPSFDGMRSLTFQGTNFGVHPTLIQIMVSSASCGMSWTSDSSILCTVPSFPGEPLDVVVIAPKYLSVLNDAVSFGNPSVSSINGTVTNAPTEGGDVITIIGSRFGRNDMTFSLYVGPRPCSPSLWVSDSTMHCGIPGGSGRNLLLQMKLGQSWLGLNSTLSYAGPQMNCPSLVITTESGRLDANFPIKVAAGERTPVILELNGTDFGGNQTQASLWLSSDDASADEIPCEFKGARSLLSHSHLRCTIYRNGRVGALYNVKLQVADNPFVSCAAMVVFGWRVVDGSLQAGTVTERLTGPVEIVVARTDILVNVSFSLQLSTSDSTALPIVSFVSDFGANLYCFDVITNFNISTKRLSIACTVMPAGGAKRFLKVEYLNQIVVSNDCLIFPKPVVIPLLSFVDPSAGANGARLSMPSTAPNVVIEVRGQHFGYHIGDLQVFFGAKSEVQCHVNSLSDSRFRCKIFEGYGAQLSLSLVISGVTTLFTNVQISFPAPQLFPCSLRFWGRAKENGLGAIIGSSTNGSDTLLLEGQNFGHNATAVVLTFGHAPTFSYGVCEILAPSNHTHLVFRVPGGVGKAYRFHLSVGNQAADVSADTYSFPPPVINSKAIVSCERADMEGKIHAFSPYELFRIQVSNVGQHLERVSFHLGRLGDPRKIPLEPVEQLSSLSKGSVVLRTMAGRGRNFRIFVVAGNQSGFSEEVFSYPYQPGLMVEPAFSRVVIGGPGLASFVTSVSRSDLVLYGFDAIGSRLTSGNSQFSLDVRAPEYQSVRSIDNWDGTYTFMYNASLAGRYILFPLDSAGMQLTSAPYYVVVSSQSRAVASQSSVFWFGRTCNNRIPCSSVQQSITARVCFRDLYGNPIDIDPQSVNIADCSYVVSDDSHNNLAFGNISSHIHVVLSRSQLSVCGRTVLGISSYKAGSMTFPILLENAHLIGSPYKISFLPGLSSFPKSKSPINANASWVTLAGLASLRDEWNNSISIRSDSRVEYLVLATSTSLKRLLDYSGGDNFSISCCTLAGMYRVVILVDGLPVRTDLIHVNPDIFDIEKSRLVHVLNVNLEDYDERFAYVRAGSQSYALAFVLDRFGNPTHWYGACKVLVCKEGCFLLEGQRLLDHSNRFRLDWHESGMFSVMLRIDRSLKLQTLQYFVHSAKVSTKHSVAYGRGVSGGSFTFAEKVGARIFCRDEFGNVADCPFSPSVSVKQMLSTGTRNLSVEVVRLDASSFDFHYSYEQSISFKFIVLVEFEHHIRGSPFEVTDTVSYLRFVNYTSVRRASMSVIMLVESSAYFELSIISPSARYSSWSSVELISGLHEVALVATTAGLYSVTLTSRLGDQQVVKNLTIIPSDVSDVNLLPYNAILNLNSNSEYSSSILQFTDAYGNAIQPAHIGGRMMVVSNCSFLFLQMLRSEVAFRLVLSSEVAAFCEIRFSVEHFTEQSTINSVFVSFAPDLSTGFVSPILGKTTVDAGASAEFMFFPRNKVGHTIIPNQKLAQYLNIIGPTNSSSSIQTNCHDSGVCAFQYVFTLSGAYTINVQGVRGAFSELIVNVVASNFDKSRSYFLCNGFLDCPSIIAGDQILLRVVARDRFENPVREIDDSFYFSVLDENGLVTTQSARNVGDGAHDYSRTYTQAGTYSVTASVGEMPLFNSVERIFVVSAGPANASTSTIVAEWEDGVQVLVGTAGNGMSILVVVRDSFYNPTGVECVLSGSGSFLDGSNSQSVQFSSESLRSRSLYGLVTLSGVYSTRFLIDGFPIPSFVSVLVKPSLATYHLSRFNAPSPLSVAAGSELSFTVTARDQYGNVRSCSSFDIVQTVSFQVKHYARDETRTSTVQLKLNGSASISHRFTLSGTYSVSAYLDYTVGSIVIVNVRPHTESLRVDNVYTPASLSAGGEASIVLTLRDSFNNLIVDDAPALGLLVVGSTSFKHLQIESTSSSFLAHFTPTAAGAYSIGLVRSGSLISELSHIEVTPGESQPHKSFASGFGVVGGRVGTLLTFSVSLRDSFGNDVSLDFVDLVSSIKYSGLQNWDTVRAVDGGFRYTAGVVGPATLNVKLQDQHISSSPFSLVFANVLGNLSPQHCFAELLNTSKLFAGDSLSFRLWRADENGHHIQNRDEVFTALFLSLSGDLPKEVDVGNELLNAMEVSTGTLIVTASSVYMLHVSIRDSHISGSPFEVVVHPGRLSVGLTKISGVGASLATAGIATSFRLIAKDSFGNPRYPPMLVDFFDVSVSPPVSWLPHVDRKSNSPYVVTYNVSVSGLYWFYVHLNDGESWVSATSTSILVVSADTSAMHSELSGLQNFFAINEALSLRFDCRDMFGNRADISRRDVSTSISGPQIVATNVSKFSSGFTLTSLISSTGSYSLTVFIDSVPVWQSVTLLLRAVKSDPSQTFTDGLGLCVGTAGRVSSFLVRGKDEYRWPVDHCGMAFSSTLYASFAITQPQLLCRGGNFSFSYTATVAGLYSLPILHAGAHVLGSPFRVIVNPGPVCASTSAVVSTLPTQITAGISFSFTVQAKDEYANLKKDGNDVFTLLSAIDSYGSKRISSTLSWEVYVDADRLYVFSATEHSQGLTHFQAMVSMEALKNFPTIILVQPGFGKSLNVSWSASTSCIVGEPVAVVVEAVDAYENRINLEALHSWQITSESSSGYVAYWSAALSMGEVSHVVFNVTRSGSFRIWLQAMHNSATVLSNSWFMDMLPAEADSQHCSASFQPVNRLIDYFSVALCISCTDYFGNVASSYAVNFSDSIVVILSANQHVDDAAVQFPVVLGLKSECELSSMIQATASGSYFVNVLIFNSVVGVTHVQGSPHPLVLAPLSVHATSSAVVFSTNDFISTGFRTVTTYSGQLQVRVFPRDKAGNQVDAVRSIFMCLFEGSSSLLEVEAMPLGSNRKAFFCNVNVDQSGLLNVTMKSVDAVAPEWVVMKSVNVDLATRGSSLNDLPVLKSSKFFQTSVAAEAGVSFSFNVGFFNAQHAPLESLDPSFLARLSFWYSTGPLGLLEGARADVLASVHVNHVRCVTTLTVSGLYELVARIDNAYLPGNLSIRVGTGLVSLSRTLIKPLQPFGLTGELMVFVVQIRDIFSNRISRRQILPSLLDVKLVLSPLFSIPCVSPSKASVNRYLCSTTVAGSYRIQLQLEEVKHVSEHDVVVQPGVADADSSLFRACKSVAASFEDVLEAGDALCVRVFVNDRFGNAQRGNVNMYALGDDVAMSTSASALNGEGMDMSIVLTVSGQYTVRVELMGKQLPGSSFIVSVNSSLWDPSHSKIFGLTTLTAGVHSSFSVHLKDRFGNFISDSSSISAAINVRSDYVIMSPPSVVLIPRELCDACDFTVRHGASSITTVVKVERRAAPVLALAYTELRQNVVRLQLSEDVDGVKKMGARSFQCSDVVYSDSVDILGKDPQCFWVSASTLRVLLGANSRLELGKSMIGFRAGILLDFNETSHPVDSESVVVRAPRLQSGLVAVLHAPAAVTYCDSSIILDASASRNAGSAGSTLFFDWSAVLDGVRTSIFDEYFEAQSRQSDFVSLEGIHRLVPSHCTLLFSVRVSDTLNRSASDSVSIEVGDSSSFTLESVGPRQRSVSPYATVRLSVAVSGHTCFSFEAVEFMWEQVSGPTVLASVLYGRSEVLFSPTIPSALHIIKVSAWPTSNTSQVVSLQFEVRSTYDVLPIFIRGGHRVVSRHQGLLLEVVSPGIDLVGTAFNWSCSPLPCVIDNEVLAAGGALLSVDSATLLPGEFVFEVVVRKEGASVGIERFNRVGTASVNVSVLPVRVPVVGLVYQRKMFRAGEQLVLRSYVSNVDRPCQHVTFSWRGSFLDGTTLYLGTNTSSMNLLLPPLFLHGGSYIFTITAQCNSGTSSAATEVYISDGPIGGAFAVSPSIGVSMETDFLFICSGWTVNDDDLLPLSYEYTAVSVTAANVPVLRTLNQRSNSHLPQFSGSIIVNAAIRDSVDTHSSRSLEVQLSEYSLSADTEVANLQWSDLVVTRPLSHLSAGRYDAFICSCGLVASLLSASVVAENNNRRLHSASVGANASLYTELLQNLNAITEDFGDRSALDTFRINGISQSLYHLCHAQRFFDFATEPNLLILQSLSVLLDHTGAPEHLQSLPLTVAVLIIRNSNLMISNRAYDLLESYFSRLVRDTLVLGSDDSKFVSSAFSVYSLITSEADTFLDLEGGDLVRLIKNRVCTAGEASSSLSFSRNECIGRLNIVHWTVNIWKAVNLSVPAMFSVWGLGNRDVAVFFSDRPSAGIAAGSLELCRRWDRNMSVWNGRFCIQERRAASVSCMSYEGGDYIFAIEDALVYGRGFFADIRSPHVAVNAARAPKSYVVLSFILCGNFVIAFGIFMLWRRSRKRAKLDDSKDIISSPFKRVKRQSKLWQNFWKRMRSRHSLLCIFNAKRRDRFEVKARILTIFFVFNVYSVAPLIQTAVVGDISHARFLRVGVVISLCLSPLYYVVSLLFRVVEPPPELRRPLFSMSSLSKSKMKARGKPPRSWSSDTKTPSVTASRMGNRGSEHVRENVSSPQSSPVPLLLPRRPVGLPLPRPGGQFNAALVGESSRLRRSPELDGRGHGGSDTSPAGSGGRSPPRQLGGTSLGRSIPSLPAPPQMPRLSPVIPAPRRPSRLSPLAVRSVTGVGSPGLSPVLYSSPSLMRSPSRSDFPEVTDVSNQSTAQGSPEARSKHLKVRALRRSKILLKLYEAMMALPYLTLFFAIVFFSWLSLRIGIFLTGPAGWRAVGAGLIAFCLEMFVLQPIRLLATSSLVAFLKRKFEVRVMPASSPSAPKDQGLQA